MNQIIIDGKTYNLVPVEEETKEETKEELKPTGWERVSFGDWYYTLCPHEYDGYRREYMDMDGFKDIYSYNNGGYFSDKQLAKDMARATSLWLKLHRFAAENQKEKIDWNDMDDYKWFIFYDYDSDEFNTNFNTVTKHITVYFDSEETAEKAIEEFKDELTWYFTEFKNTRRFE